MALVEVVMLVALSMQKSDGLMFETRYCRQNIEHKLKLSKIDTNSNPVKHQTFGTEWSKNNVHIFGDIFCRLITKVE